MYYLDSIRIAGHEALESDVSIASDTQPLTLTYKLDGGSVRGVIESCGAAHVLLIPQDPARRRSGFNLDTTCGQNGGFEFANVRPGEYFGIAIVPGNLTPLAKGMVDDAVWKQASRISVRPNESTSAEIRVIVLP